MQSPSLLNKLPSFTSPLKRKEKPKVEPLVGLQRLLKQLEDVTAAVSNPSWLVKELSAILKNLRNSADLLKPQCQDWTNVTQELKDLVETISTIFKRMSVNFDKHVTDSREFEKYVKDAAFATDFNKLMVNTHCLQLFLLRFGMNGGIISEVGCSQYTLPTTLWRYPMAYLPDRNLLFVPRSMEMRRIHSALNPYDVISYNCIMPPAGIYGVGITELLTEYCYRSIEDGIYGAVVWITGSTNAAIIQSFRQFAKRVRVSDKSFGSNLSDIINMDGEKLVTSVIDWLQKLSYPWLIVFDGVATAHCMHRRMIPQYGRGCVVFATHSNCLGNIKALCSAKPIALEVSLLTITEKKDIANCLLNYSDPKFDDAEIIDLLKYFGGYPLEIIESCSVITTGNIRLQWNVGIHQFLKKLKFAEARGLLERDLVVYQTLNAALEVAVQLPQTSALAAMCLLDLLPYVDCNEVDATFAMKWLLSSEETLTLSVLGDGLEMVAESDVAVLTTDSMLTVTVMSIIPHDLHSNGGTHHTWTIRKTFIELQTFFDDMKRSSDVLATSRFPGKPHTRSNQKHADGPFKVSLGDINFALRSLCIDPAWKALCEDADVKLFIGIQSEEDVYANAGSRMFALLQPLAAVGIVRMKHSFGLIDPKDQCVSFSVCGDFHRAMVSLVEEEGRQHQVLDKVCDFILGCLNDDVLSPIPAEVLIPHAIRVSSFCHLTDSSMSLVTNAYAAAERLDFNSDAALLAVAGLALAQSGHFGLKGTSEEVKWYVRDAKAMLAMDINSEPSVRLHQALELAVQLNSKHDIAVIQDLLALAAENMEKYSEAEHHLVKSLEAWQMCYHDTKPRDVANCLQRLAKVYRHTKKFDKSLEFDNMAIGVLTKIHGPVSEIVLQAQFDFSGIQILLGKYEAAITTLANILQAYDAENGVPDTNLQISELKLLHPKSAIVCMKIADCYIAKTLYFEAEILLNQCIDALFEVHRDKPHESVALVLEKIGHVQTCHGNMDAALKSFKDSLDIYRCIFDANDIRIAHLLNKIGNHLKLMGKFAFAESHFKGAIDIYEKKPCRDGAYALMSLAEMMLSQDREDEALTAATKSIATYRRIDTSSDAVAHEFAVALTLKADILKQQGKLDEALLRLEDVQFALDNMSTDNDASVAEVYEKIADIYRLKEMDVEAAHYEQLANAIYESSSGAVEKKQPVPLAAGKSKGGSAKPSNNNGAADDTTQLEDQVSSAVSQHQESIDDQEQKEAEDQNFLRMQEDLISNLVLKYGEKHQRVASALNNLSHLLIKRGRYEEAQRMLVASLEILLELYGDSHAHVATVYQNIGHLYQRRGRYEEAEALFQQALTVRRDISGDISAHVAQSLNSLGLVFRAQGKYIDAKLCMEESLNIRRVLYGHSHFSIAVALNNLGLLQKSMWLFKDAEKSLRDGLAIRRATFAEGHPSIAASMVNLGTLLVGMGKLSEAKKLFEDALVIQRKAYGSKGHPDMTKSMTYLADLNMKENNLPSAKTVLEQLVRSRADIHGEQNEDFYMNIARLSKLYHAMNLEEDAIKLDNILVERSGSVKSKVDDKFVMLPEMEEEDKIVSRLMSIGSFADGSSSKTHSAAHANALQHDRNHSFLTHDHEEILRWLAAVSEDITLFHRKKKQEVESFRDVTVALEAAFNESVTDLQGLNEALEGNKVKLLKLEKLTQQNRKYEREMIDVQYDSANLDREFEIAAARKAEMEAEVERANSQSASSKKTVRNVEEALPRFESLRVSILESVTNIDSKTDLLFQKRQELSNLSNGKTNTAQQVDVGAAEQEKAKLEGSLRTDQVDQYNVIQDICDLCKQLGLAIRPPSTDKTHTKPWEVEGKLGHRKRSESFVDDDDNTSLDSFGSDVDSDSDVDTANDKSSKALQKLKKQLKRQKMLIDLLRSQLIGLGVRPIEEVVSFEKAETRLKDSLRKLLEGNEEAAAEFERWDEYVRNHPEYKRRELEKIALWHSENNPLNSSALTNIKSFVPVDIYMCNKDFIFAALPKPLARRVWNEKSLWLLRMSPLMIAKLHIADLQSKYSTQSLDEVELRAVFAALPSKFENDATGEKENWRAAILQRLQSKRTQLPWSGSGAEPPEEVVSMFMKSISRNGAYRNVPEFGPFDPDAPPAVFETAGAVFQESAKYDPSQVHSSPMADDAENLPVGSFSILETVQIMHNKFSNQRASEGPKKEETLLSEEEDFKRKERRRASLAKLRARKADVEIDVEKGVLRLTTEDAEIDDSYEMFPTGSLKSVGSPRPQKTKGLMGGLQEAVLKRRAMLEGGKTPSFRQSSSKSLGGDTDSSLASVRPGKLAKGESFRAAPHGKKPSSPTKAGMLGAVGKQQSITLTGPQHLGGMEEDGDESTSPRPAMPGMARQPSILHKLFSKKADVPAVKNIGAPQKSSFNAFSS